MAAKRPPNPLVDKCVELFSNFGESSARAMFGGYGVYLDGKFIAIIDDGELWLKFDAETEPRFIEKGCRQFSYMTKDGPISMAYYSSPAEVLGSVDAAQEWVQLAIDAVDRKAVKRKSKR